MTDTTSSPASPTFAELFPLPDEARHLDRFLGTWRVQGVLTVDGNDLPMTGAWRFTPAAAGWGIASELVAHVEGLGSYEEHDLVGFDIETGLYHIYSLTNSGAVHDHVARWRTDDAIDFEFTGLQGGKPYRETGTMTFRTDGAIHATSEDYIDGALASRMAVDLTRM
jgi:hypothetical protein